CSPPKIVLALRPASRAMSMKVTPMSRSDFAGGVVAGCAAWPKSGQASESTSENVNTSTERERDRRNVRRDDDKGYPFARARDGSEPYCPAARSGFASGEPCGRGFRTENQDSSACELILWWIQPGSCARLVAF